MFLGRFLPGKYFCIPRYNFATAFSVHGPAQVFAPVIGDLILAGYFLLGSKNGHAGLSPHAGAGPPRGRPVVRLPRGKSLFRASALK